MTGKESKKTSLFLVLTTSNIKQSP